MAKHIVKSWQVRSVEYLQELNRPRGKAFYICLSCKRRKVLARELWQYVQPPKCLCGKLNWGLDRCRHKEWLENTGSYAICKCDAHHFPHKPASTVWCRSHPTGPTEKDYLDRYGECNEGIYTSQTPSCTSNLSTDETLWDSSGNLLST